MDFTFLDSPDSNRVYLARIHQNGTYTVTSNNFDAVVDVIKETQTGTTSYTLPMLNITNVPNGIVYGTLDIRCDFVKQPVAPKIAVTTAGVQLAGTFQPGTYVTPHWSTNLVAGDWHAITNATQYVAPTLSNFDTMQESVTFSNLPTYGDRTFYRISVNTTNPYPALIFSAKPVVAPVTPAVTRSQPVETKKTLR